MLENEHFKSAYNLCSGFLGAAITGCIITYLLDTKM